MTGRVQLALNVNNLAEAGLAAVDERDTTCCYARQDKFWVTGAPNGERWEIYTVLQDSATFWADGGQESWDAARTELDSDAPCRGGPRAASEDGTEAPACAAGNADCAWPGLLWPRTGTMYLRRADGPSAFT
jgi:hypothetical protein